MKEVAKGILVYVLVIVALIGLGLVIKWVFFPVNTLEKSMDMGYEVVDDTLTGENAIYNYEWFKMQEESIAALYKKEVRANKDLEELKAMLPESRSEWSRDDKIEYDRLNTIATGIGMQIDSAIAEYNARSSMVNRAIFKDNLPTNLSRAYYEAQELTK
jgi:hypothetical protein